MAASTRLKKTGKNPPFHSRWRILVYKLNGGSSAITCPGKQSFWLEIEIHIWKAQRTVESLLFSE